jgi:hypothetical protein
MKLTENMTAHEVKMRHDVYWRKTEQDLNKFYRDLIAFGKAAMPIDCGHRDDALRYLTPGYGAVYGKSPAKIALDELRGFHFDRLFIDEPLLPRTDLKKYMMYTTPRGNSHFYDLYTTHK